MIVRLGDEPLLCDELKLTKAEDREALAEAILERCPGLDPEAVAAKLLAAADEAATRPNAPPQQPLGEPVDVSMLARPERIVTPELSAVSIPAMNVVDGTPTGRWLLYICWSDGRRECRPLETSLDIGDGRKLWIHPSPGEPGPNTPAGWSDASRRAWLEGAAAPDPADVFKRLCISIERHLDLPRHEAPGITATLVAWSILSYCYHAFPAVPYLYIGGPLGSGKSRVYEILARLVYRSLASSNLTGPALFRTLHDRGGTLLADEAERLRATNDPATAELLSMLLAGYKRGGQATRLEAVGDSFRPVAFDVYGPKAVACIAGLPPALASRCIPILMFRAPKGSEKPRRRIDADPQMWQQLRDDLHLLALEHGPTWLELPGRTEVCPPMSGRDFELWQPLLAIASWLEGCGCKGLLQLLQDHDL
ncbi:MAG: hypothetical protein ACOY3P_02970, partial [Planctomycetota bacterium]